ncbi:MAG TPA: hypothetical protein VHC91_26330 [Trinickia sp.]|uniref:hypothetical protein n=1 Tax=Trinickia sp. TaxID=2571163 RepID=UPI002B8B1EBD|nr:hypothetical protein [Trinickia sp.]HVW53885.1 hypothetical protein [Trinickia sp.]
MSKRCEIVKGKLWKWVRVPAIVVSCAIILLTLKNTFIPNFEGDFYNSDRSVELSIEDGDGVWRVSKTEIVDKRRVTNEFVATKKYWSLRFGGDADQQSIVFHPNTRNFYFSFGKKNVRLLRKSWLSESAVRHPYVAEGVVLAWIAGLILLLFDQKSRIHPSMIYPTWLAFFFALCVSAAVLVYAGNSNSFDASGNPINGCGALIINAMNFFMDIETESIIFAGVLFVLAVPQGLAYIAAGVSGAAQEVRFVALAWKITTSLLAKSFISAAAVAMSVSVVGNHYGWIRGAPKNILADLSIFLLLFSYGLVLLFFSVPDNNKKSSSKELSRAQRVLASIHKFMTRRMPATDESAIIPAVQNGQTETFKVGVVVQRERTQ